MGLLTQAIYRHMGPEEMHGMLKEASVMQSCHCRVPKFHTIQFQLKLAYLAQDRRTTKDVLALVSVK